jgi:hypothetical protein
MSTHPPPWRISLRLLVAVVLPLIAFLVLQRVLGNATGALAITDAIPMLGLVAFGIWHRRVEPLVLIAAAVLSLALVLTAASGSSLPLELRRSVFPGAVGLAFLISLAVRRPLLVIASAKLGDALAQQTAQARPNLDWPGPEKALTTLTAIVAVTALADAAAQIVFALTVSTATFAEVARVASYAIIGSGLAVGALYLRFARARQRREGGGR